MTKRALLLLIALTMAPLSSFGWDPAEKQSDGQKAAETIATFKAKDKGIQRFFNSAYGYAVFPSVGKGGFGIGGAYGEGVVYQRGKAIGSSKLTQLTIGFQLGAQAYSEIIFFKDKKAMDRFKESKLELSAQASAVAITAGASAAANYESGVAVFTMAKGGLMYEASVGGQGFSFTPY